jgi:cytochrome c biogenesis protein CcdA
VPYQLFADLVLITHVAIVSFVVLGLVLIIVGNLLHWQWVNSWWLRIAHIVTIAIVVGEAWFGIACPFTIWEQRLRQLAGEKSYEGGFIEHWLGGLLFYDAPLWVFTLGYTLFGALVAFVWWKFPPRRRV